MRLYVHTHTIFRVFESQTKTLAYFLPTEYNRRRSLSNDETSVISRRTSRVYVFVKKLILSRCVKGRLFLTPCLTPSN